MTPESKLPRRPNVCIHGWERCATCNHDDDITNPKDALSFKKIPLRLIPPPALAYLAMVMDLGAKKYGPYNWRERQVRLTVYLEAAMRHILAVLDGESIDEESNMPHVAHSMACMAIILDAYALSMLVDDRPKPGKFANLLKEFQK